MGELNNEVLYDGTSIQDWSASIENALDLHYQCELDIYECIDIPEEVSSNKSFWIDLCKEFGPRLGLVFRAFASEDLLEDEDFMNTMISLDSTLMDELDTEEPEEMIIEKMETGNDCEQLQPVATEENTILFGTYPQNKNGKDKTPIKWRVLDRKDDKALIITEYGIDCVPYNKTYNWKTWDTCTLRKWMNGTFLKNAFSADEQAQIQNTNVPADKNPKYDVNPGNATTDKVFLLSITEVEKYFSSDSARQCKPTKYAVAKGAELDFNNGNCDWWLRSSGDSQGKAAYVYSFGPVDYSGYGELCDFYAVRPALWITLKS